MTVSYSREVATSSFFCLYRLLFKWKGSIWQLVWHEYLVWLAFYLALSLSYRFAMTDFQREVFEDISVFCNTYSTFIPITFMLGFYVQAVFSRWQNIFNNIGWIDTPGLAIAAHVEGTTELARNLRRTVVRYLVLVQAIVLRDISVQVKKRFPTMNHLVTAGFMTQAELDHFTEVPSKVAKYWVPAQWAFAHMRAARQMGLISSDIALVNVNEKIYSYRNQVLSLALADWVSVPLAYTQVVHLAVRTFFVMALMGRQFINPSRNLANYTQTADIYIPVMSSLQFIFIVGWVKVAEVMLNPLGEDNDDFETNWLLDRNLQVGLSMVDDQFDKYPKMERDAFWEDTEIEPLYTPETANLRMNPQIGSCAHIHPHGEDSIMLKLNNNNNNGIKRFTSIIEAAEEGEVVPVAGLEKRDSAPTRDGSFRSSMRRLSAIVKNIRIKGRSRLDHRRSTTTPTIATSATSCESQATSRSREDSITEQEVIQAVGYSRPVPPTPRPKRMPSPLSVQELSEIWEEGQSEDDVPTAPPRRPKFRVRASSTITEPIVEDEEEPISNKPDMVKRTHSWI